jgi:hypothetical protein
MRVVLRAVPSLNLNSVLCDGTCKFMVEGKGENCGFVDGEGTIMARYISDPLFPYQLGAVERAHMGLKEEESAPIWRGLYSTTSIFSLVGGNYVGKAEAKKSNCHFRTSRTGRSCNKPPEFLLSLSLSLSQVGNITNRTGRARWGTSRAPYDTWAKLGCVRRPQKRHFYAVYQ